nr:nuclear transport factor 2 family protein [Enterococcus sp. 665A]
MNKKIVDAFVQAINQQNIPRINDLMAENFQFIDTYGGCENKEAMEAGWPGYFQWFPDYQITIDDYLANDQFAVILGKASGSYLGNPERYWEFPAAWKVVVNGQQIEVWQIFCDSKKQLDSMG